MKKNWKLDSQIYIFAFFKSIKFNLKELIPSV